LLIDLNYNNISTEFYHFPIYFPNPKRIVARSYELAHPPFYALPERHGCDKDFLKLQVAGRLSPVVR